MKTRKRLTGALAIPALAVALAACGAGEPDAPAAPADSTADAGTDAATDDSTDGTDAGGDGADGGTDTAALQAIVDKYSAPIEEAVPTETYPVVEDKLVVLIPCTYASEACARGVDAATEAAESLGWEVRMIDPAGNPENSRQAIDQAIQLGADGIIFTAAVGDQLTENLARAREEGIFLVNSMSPPDDRFDVDVAPDEDATGEMAAASVGLDSDGQAKVLVLTDPAFPSIQARTEAFEKWLPELCPTCEIVDTIETQMSQLQSGLPPQVQATLTANPDINYIFTHTGAAVVATQATVERSTNGENIRMLSFDGNSANLGYIAEERNQYMDVIKPMEHTGYLSVYEMNRLFNEGPGEHVVIEMPKRLVTKDTLPELPWEGDSDWKAGFEELFAS